jgi:hypothetical protein
VIYVVRSNTGQFYRRGKLVRSHTAASFGHSPSGVAGILTRARTSFPELQWEAVPFRELVAGPPCIHAWQRVQYGATYHDLKCAMCGEHKRETWD